MTEEKSPIFIGVAWPYVNGDLHVGHLAGYLLPCDIFSRFNRQLGHEVLMVSGSDCFGTPITLEADKRGVTPTEVVNEHHAKHLELFKKAQIEYDLYTKTDTPNHRQVTQDLFVKMAERGYIFTDKSDQYYSDSDQRFLPDRYVEGTCPKCHTSGARSDQCDACGSPLSQGELIDPVSKLTGQPVTIKPSEHYFVDWPKLQPFLEDYFAAHSKNWRPWVAAETKGWLNTGLQPRAITRDLDWGIEIPVDRLPEKLRLKDVTHKRIYVWFDAVIGYLSAAIEWANSQPDKLAWEHYWKNPAAKHYYFMGKDNLIFHTLFWPGQLHAADESLHLPDVPAINQFLTLGEEKFSKSKGVIVDSQAIIDRYGVDAVRFYLTAIMPEYTDAAFTWEDFAAKTNNILIGTIGNFINRTLTLAKEVDFATLALTETDSAQSLQQLTAAADALSKVEFRRYLEELTALADFGNKHLAETKPWSLDRSSEEFIAALRPALAAVIALANGLRPLIPHAVATLDQQLGTSYAGWIKDATTLNEQLKQVKLTEIKPLFSRIEL